MASLYSETRKNGKAWRIGLSIGGERTNILLGKMPKKTAELCLSMVEQIQAANASGQSYSVEVAAWTKNIGDELHTKLVNAGLLRQRQWRTLGKFITDYIEERSDWKPGTQTTFRVATDKMMVFFGRDTPLENITAEQCHKYKAELLRDYSQGYTAKNVEWAKSLFTAAVKRKLLAENPFETVVAGRHSNHDRMFFVSAEDTQALIDACNSPKQRLIIALARYGGLRCPSELTGLKWSEVNWARNRFTVCSPKTEKQGKSQRVVPIFKELYPFLLEASEAAPENIDRVFPEITDKKSLGSFIARLAKRAGIPLWEKPFQNMRSTRATELIEEYPAHVVNYWLGHSEAVAMAHYRQTGKAIDKFYEQAAGQQPTPIQNFTHEHAGIGCSGVEKFFSDLPDRVPFHPTMARFCREFLGNAEDAKNASMTPTGIEPVPRP
jgi:integrase